MKQKILLLLLCIVPDLTWAQNDTLLRNAYIAKVNDYRKSKALPGIKQTESANLAVMDILNHYDRIKDPLGRFKTDYIRTYLKKHCIHDYQFEIIENNAVKDKSVKLNPEIKKVLGDSLFKVIGVASDTTKNIILLIKKYVDFETFYFGQIALNWRNEYLVDTSLIKDSVQFKTSLDEIKYVKLKSLNEVNKIKEYSVIKPKNGSFTIEIERNVRYIILFNKKGEIIYEDNY